MPTAPITVDSTVPKTLFLSTFMPEAAANLGLAPAVYISIPLLLLEKSHTSKQQPKKNSSSPVGI